MNNILLTCRISQAQNLFLLIITSLFSFGLFYYKSILQNATGNLLDFISNFQEIPELTNDLLLFILLAILFLNLLWKIASTHFTYYEFDEERIIMHLGVLNKQIDYLDYYRIKDYQITQPLLIRIMGLHNIEIISTDRSHPYLKLTYLNNFKQGENVLRNGIKNTTETGRGREIDVV
jgi:uncharacterized membrane protein YdbT with pleckstrin-like domain